MRYYRERGWVRTSVLFVPSVGGSFGGGGGGGTGGDPGAGGDALNHAQPQTDSKDKGRDPCFGLKASDLDYSKEHFTERHITNDDPEYRGKSKYVFLEGSLSNEPNYNKRLEMAQGAIKALSAFTFTNAHGYQQSNGNILFVYAFTPVQTPVGSIWIVGQTGSEQKSNANMLTNVNTLVLGSDCRTVITSYPGLPSNYTVNDYRINGGLPIFRRP